MKAWQKSSLIYLLSLGLLAWGGLVKAAECPLLPQTAYKSKESSAVYYINRTCTKRAFTSETVYFAYFSSWKQVKITTAKILKAVPNDSRGPMQARIVPIEPQTPPQPILTQPVETLGPLPDPIKTAPTSSALILPIVTPHPVIDPRIQVLTGAMANFLHCPDQNEVARLEQDFNFVWSRDWENFPFDCNYQTKAPSRLAIYATVRLLKDLEFRKPLPFTNGKNLYAYLTTKKLTIIPGLDCAQYSTGWDYRLNLGGVFSRTHAVNSGSASCEWADMSRYDLLDDFVYNPLYKAGVLVHEAHHAINGSLHVNFDGSDADINDNSAWAAQFYFYAWLNLYSNNVDMDTKEEARGAAMAILNERFSKNKCPNSVELKIVVNTLSPNLCL